MDNGMSPPFAPVAGQRLKKRRIRFVWTCSDYAHHEHRWHWTAWLCGRVQRAMHAFRR
jgi:hypothetical protein